MHHKHIALSGIKTAGLADGQFEGFASVFDHLDSQGDIVRRGAFAKSLQGGAVVPLIWEHQSKDPRAFVGEVKSAEETPEGLKIVGQFDMDTEAGAAAYRQVKARRVGALSIGYIVTQQRKGADGANELTDLDLLEVSVVARPANDRALIGAVKSGEASEDKSETSRLVKARKAAAEFVAADETTDEEDQDADLTVGERLVAALEAALADAQELIDTAETDGRDLTEDEAEAVEKAHRRARAHKSDLESWNESTPALRHGSQFLADVMHGRKCSPEEFTARWGTSDAPADALTKSVTTATIRTKHTKKETHSMDTQDQFLQFGSGRKAAASAIVAKMLGTDGANAYQGGSLTGTKALTTSGQVITDVPVAATVVATDRPAVSLLDVIPSQRRTTPTYRFIRQNSRALAAAAVAEGAEKPVSAMGTETIDNTVSVIAHLSEPIDKFVLQDAPQLARFVQEEMLYGLDVAIQAQALSGSGTGANQTGLLNTSGVQVQAFATNILTSVRKAITAQETLGYAPSVLVISPADWEALELLATTDAALSYRGVPLDQGERKIWGLRAVLSTGLPAKTAVVLDPNAVSIDTVGGVEIEWAKEAGDLFSHNQIQARVETRIGVSVYQPAAVVKVATAA